MGMPEPMSTGGFLATVYTAIAGASLLLAAAAPEPAMQAAQDRFEEGFLWPGGPPLLIVIGGSIGGSLFSIGFELLRMRDNEALPMRRLVVKMAIQPLLAIVGTTPTIKVLQMSVSDLITMGETSLLAVSFCIGGSGVFVLTILMPAIENRWMPKIIGLIDWSIDQTIGRVYKKNGSGILKGNDSYSSQSSLSQPVPPADMPSSGGLSVFDSDQHKS